MADDEAREGEERDEEGEDIIEETIEQKQARYDSACKVSAVCNIYSMVIHGRSLWVVTESITCSDYLRETLASFAECLDLSLGFKAAGSGRWRDANALSNLFAFQEGRWEEVHQFINKLPLIVDKLLWTNSERFKNRRTLIWKIPQL